MRDFQRTERNGAYCEVRNAVSQVSSLLSSSGVRSVSSSGVRSVRWTHLRQKCPVRCFRCRRVREIRVYGRKHCRVGTYISLEAGFSANAAEGRCAARSCRSIRQCRRVDASLVSKHTCSAKCGRGCCQGTEKSGVNCNPVARGREYLCIVKIR